MADENSEMAWSAFRGTKLIASGPIGETALKLHALAEGGNLHDVLIFDDRTSQQIDLDLRGTAGDVLTRLRERFPNGLIEPTPVDGETTSTVKAGRPKLGVVAREVTLLPRHWDWLGSQPGGASVALRKLVEDARRSGTGREALRAAQDAAYKFMSAMAGNQEGFEEAARALFAQKREDFDANIAKWPKDIRKHAAKLAAPAFGANT